MKTNYLIFLLTFLLHGTAHAQPEWIVYNTSNSGLSHDYITTIAEDAKYNKWIGTGSTYCGGGGVAKFDGNTWTIYKAENSGLVCNHVVSIVIDNNDNKWIGTSWEMGGGYIQEFDGTDWIHYSAIPVIKSSAVDNNNNKWFATIGGLHRFNGVNWAIYNTSNTGMPSSSTTSISIDINGDLWIGTVAGLVRFNGTNWNGTVYDISNSALPDNYITSTAIDLNGDKWIGTNGGGLAKFNGINWTVYDTSNSTLPDNFISSIDVDLNGDKWIGTYYGVLKFDDTNWTIFDTSNSALPDNRVSTITIDANGNKWIGTRYDGVAVFNESGINWDPPKVDIEDTLEPETVIQLYPNPTSGQFVLTVGDELPAAIYIYDVFGKLIKQSSIIPDISGQANPQSTIDVTQHAKGVYLVKVIQGEEIFIQKLIHQ